MKGYFQDRIGPDPNSKLRRVHRLLVSCLNAIRRKLSRPIIKISYTLGGKEPLKLHIGCGSQHLDGYVNIDGVKTNATDFVCDVRRLPYPNESAELIESYHVLEHFPVCLMASVDSAYGEKYGLLIDILKDWQRVLRPGGKLIMELPDFDKMVEEYLKADDGKKEELLAYIYGGFRFGNEYDLHRWGPNTYRLTYMLEKAGFADFEFMKATDYHMDAMPCMRVECIKADG